MKPLSKLLANLTITLLRFADPRMINGKTLYPESRCEELQRVLGFTKQQAEDCLKGYNHVAN